MSDLADACNYTTPQPQRRVARRRRNGCSNTYAALVTTTISTTATMMVAMAVSFVVVTAGIDPSSSLHSSLCVHSAPMQQTTTQMSHLGALLSSTIPHAMAHTFDFTKMKVLKLSEKQFQSRVIRNEDERGVSHSPTRQPPWFVMLYSPQCAHCESMLPLFDAAARASPQQLGGVQFGAINGAVSPKLCDALGMRKYPLFIYVVNGRVHKYNGATDTMESFLEASNTLLDGYRRGTFFEGDISTFGGLKIAMGLRSDALDDGVQYTQHPYDIQRPMFVVCSRTRHVASGGEANVGSYPPFHSMAEGMVMQEGRPRFLELVEDEGPHMSAMPGEYCVGGGDPMEPTDSSKGSLTNCLNATSCYSPLKLYWSIRKVCHAVRANAGRLRDAVADGTGGSMMGFGATGIIGTPSGTAAPRLGTTHTGLGPNGEVLVVVSDRTEDPIPYIGPAWEGMTWEEAVAANAEAGVNSDAVEVGARRDATFDLGLRTLLSSSAPKSSATEAFRTNPQLALWVWENSFNLVERASFAALQAASSRALVVALVTKKDVSIQNDDKYFPVMKQLARDRYAKFVAKQRELLAPATKKANADNAEGMLKSTFASRSTNGCGGNGVFADLSFIGAGAIAAHALRRNLNLSTLDERQTVGTFVQGHTVLPPQFVLGNSVTYPDWYDFVGVAGRFTEESGSRLPMLFVADPNSQITYEFPLQPLRIKGDGSAKKKKKKSKIKESASETTNGDTKKAKKANTQSAKGKKTPLLTHAELLVKLNAFLDGIENGTIEGVPFSPIGRVAILITKIVPFSGLLLEAIGYEYMPFVMVMGAIPVALMMVAATVYVARREAREAAEEAEAEHAANDQAAGNGMRGSEETSHMSPSKSLTSSPYSPLGGSNTAVCYTSSCRTTPSTAANQNDREEIATPQNMVGSSQQGVNCSTPTSRVKALAADNMLNGSWSTEALAPTPLASEGAVGGDMRFLLASPLHQQGSPAPAFSPFFSPATVTVTPKGTGGTNTSLRTDNGLHGITPPSTASFTSNTSDDHHDDKDCGHRLGVVGMHVSDHTDEAEDCSFEKDPKRRASLTHPKVTNTPKTTANCSPSNKSLLGNVTTPSLAATSTLTPSSVRTVPKRAFRKCVAAHSNGSISSFTSGNCSTRHSTPFMDGMVERLECVVANGAINTWVSSQLGKSSGSIPTLRKQ